MSVNGMAVQCVGWGGVRGGKGKQIEKELNAQVASVRVSLALATFSTRSSSFRSLSAVTLLRHRYKGTKVQIDVVLRYCATNTYRASSPRS